MATVVDVSSVLGEYMLKGWILSNDICKTCSKVPLMRSKSSPPSEFCANCDGGPGTRSSATAAFSHNSASSVDSTSQIASRPSTPPTEVSTALSSPTFAPPMDMEEIARRRQQSDMASSEIGKRLLKGWAMLADECPNIHCYGIPLVRPPKSNGEQDPRKECVVCHTVYINRPGGNGLEVLNTSHALTNTPTLPAQHDSQSQILAAVAPLSSDATAARRARIPDRVPSVVETLSFIQTTIRTLQSAAETLEQTLQTLTERIHFLSASEVFDAVMIGQTADAISKVSHALMTVKELGRSERQASAT
ncbi:hypothetical protein BC835DRAFT_1268613 [Cytidiella melzeri]|nr:hypothetical protein BC835DRAFT_1268613 [Cytidiella melzeri]